jgi:hypothetical protein
MGTVGRRTRGPVRSLAVSILALLVMLSLNPSVDGGRPTISSLTPPYIGASAAVWNRTSSIGCGIGASIVGPSLNATAGMGALNLTATARGCQDSINRHGRDMGLAEAEIWDKIPAVFPSGSGGVNVTWSVNISAWIDSYQHPHCGYMCQSEGAWNIQVGVWIAEVANQSSIGSARNTTHDFLNRISMGFNNSSSIFQATCTTDPGCYVPDQAWNRSVTLWSNFTGKFNSSHRYVVVAWLLGQVAAATYFHGTRVSAVVDVSGSHGARLASVQLW